MAEAAATDPGSQFSAFKQGLAAAAEASTVGVATLSGVSPKNAALEQLARRISTLPATDEQVEALRAILAEAATLWPDQNAHVISTIIQDLLIHGRISLQPAALAPVGQMLVHAALQVEPELASDGVVNDSISHDVLISYTSFLVQRPEFSFSEEIRSRLDRAGFHEQTADVRMREGGDNSPERQANRLRHQIALKSAYQMEPADLQPLIEATAGLPEDLRGRLLAMLVNVSWNTLRSDANTPLIDRLGVLIEALPPRYRITPLEAFYNQINILPHELAQRCWPVVKTAIERLPEIDDQRFNRTRKDLRTSLRSQGELLGSAEFLPGESLKKFAARTEGQVTPLT